MVCDAGPNGVENGNHHAAPELLVDSPNEVGQEDSNVEAGEVSLDGTVSDERFENDNAGQINSLQKKR